jgi:hypothetical protein
MTEIRDKGTIHGENGELFVLSNEQRLFLAKCRPKITIYERATQVNALGVIGHKEKIYHCAVVLCADKEVYRKVDNDFIRTVKKVELQFEMRNKRSVIEQVKLDGLRCEDLNYAGDWEFEVDLSGEEAARLLKYLKGG